MKDRVEVEVSGEVELIASGYEWDCLSCDALNQEIGISQNGTVKCKKCGKVFCISDLIHVEQWVEN